MTAVDSSGIHLKLGRAVEHIVALDQAVKQYRKTEPYSFTTSIRDVDEAARVYSLTATVREQPPEWWGPIIGDVVHNVRSALDYAIWEQAASSKRGTHTQFPIVTDPDRWDGEARRRLAGVAPRITELTRAAQPFVRMPGDPKRHPLAVLHDLSRIDKHRTLHALALVSAMPYVGAGEVDVVSFDYVAREQAVRDGDEVLRFTARLKRPGAVWGVDPHADYNVAIQDTYDSMLVTLRQVLSDVRQIVLWFEHPDAPWVEPAG